MFICLTPQSHEVGHYVHMEDDYDFSHQIKEKFMALYIYWFILSL